MLIGTKVFGMLILLAVSKLYTTDHYDFRLMGMALVIVTGAGAQIMFEIHKFENYHFHLLRQLPIPVWRRISYVMISTMILMIPEAGIIISYFPNDLSFSELIQGLVFLITGLLFWYAFLFRKDQEQEAFMKIVFAFSLSGIVLTLFAVPLWGLAAITFLMSTFWWNKFYYRFEYSSTTLQ